MRFSNPNNDFFELLKHWYLNYIMNNFIKKTGSEGSINCDKIKAKIVNRQLYHFLRVLWHIEYILIY